MSQRIYVSAPFELQSKARAVRDTLVEHGYTVTSSWLDEQPSNELSPCDMAERDVADMFRADVLVSINPQEWERQGTGGRHFEAGVAFMLGMPTFIYGVRSNVFHSLSNVKAVSPSFPEILASLKEYFSR